MSDERGEQGRFLFFVFRYSVDGNFFVFRCDEEQLAITVKIFGELDVVDAGRMVDNVKKFDIL